MLPTVSETLPQRSTRWLGYGLCILAALVIWGLIAHFLAATPTDPFGVGLDVDFYRREGEQIRTGGLFAFASPVHAYGYPLFVAICLTLGDLFQQPVTSVVAYLQLVFHIAAAGLAFRLFLHLSREHSPTFPKRLFVFALLVCNPLLLMATFYLLSDSLTVFWLTLMLAAALLPWRGRWWIVGAALGLCIVTRPYHQIWAIILLVALLSTLTLFRWIQRYAVYINPREVRRALLQVTLPVLVIVGLQYLITYQQNGFWSIVGGTGNKAIQIHITGSLYYYRYETLLQPDGFVSGVRYWNWAIYEHLGRLGYQEPSMIALYAEQLRVDALSLPLMVLIKMVSLFQHYDLRMFLLDLGIVSPLAFVVGLWLFITFVAVLQAGVLRGWTLLRQRPRGLKLTPSVVLFWVVVSYVGLYAIATAPEPRFIFPIFPTLTILGVLVVDQPRPRWQRISAAVIGVMLYGIAAIIILPSAILA